MPSAGDVAQQTATSAIASKLGGLGGFGGFGHKKKAADPAPTQPAEPSNPSNPGAADAMSSVLIESSTTLSDFSAAPVDASHFQVPAEYKQVTPPGIRTSS
jgi:hypothetical protein